MLRAEEIASGAVGRLMESGKKGEGLTGVLFVDPKAPSFVDLEDDHPGTKPSYGVAGYASDGKAVVANHRYDLWLLPLDGSAATGTIRVHYTGADERPEDRVVIHEIMYHPAARADGKNLEFIEIYNSAPWAEDLSGYRLSGSVDYTFPAGTTIPAQGYLLVWADGEPDQNQADRADLQPAGLVERARRVRHPA